MEVVIAPDDDAVARIAADVIVRTVRSRAAPVLGLATGSTPIATYDRLVALHRAGEATFAAANAVLLDEYVGLAREHPESYRTVVERAFVDHVDLPAGNLHGPDVWADDVVASCAAYEALLADLGGVDVQVLGIGTDGHLGFNEPGSSLSSRTRLKTLTASTRLDNARFFSSLDEVPHHVITQGLGTILDAGHLLLLATGPTKAGAVARAIEGPVAARCPASVLQLHPHATVVLDEAAATGLELADYYREIQHAKPSWQLL
ncbi:MAG: glucosamine-6-phosphate deaminase [Acidimicrobiia bacterium]